MTETTELVITTFAADVLQRHQHEILQVYRDAYSDKIDMPFSTEDRYWERLVAYASREGFALVEGRIDGDLVGYALGFPLPSGSKWWSGLLQEADPDFTREDGKRTFALTYIMVRKEHRRRGYARQLHDALLKGRPEERATLLVVPTNAAAHAAYASWGWVKVGDLQPFDDAPIYNALVLIL